MHLKSQNINLKTKIPAKGTLKFISDTKRVESRSMHGQLPIVWSKAVGHSIYDIAGNKFIDFTSTIFVTNIGHSNKNLIKKLKQTLNSRLLHSYAYVHEQRKDYLKKLLKFCGKNFQKAFLMSSGTEATEAALKLMRLNGIKNKKRKNGIVCFDGNWHGRTMGAQFMSGNKNQKKWIGYQDKNIHHLPFPYPWNVEEKNGKDFFIKSINDLNKRINVKKDICGFMLETFQGWGAIFYPKSFVKELEKFCKKNKILLAFDEMQSGFARTGKKFGFEHYNVNPDLICCGKGMGGGVPLSGVIGKKKIMDLPDIGDMSSTNSSNPLSCSAGISVIDEIISKNLVKNTQIKGKILSKKLDQIKTQFKDEIKYVSSKGLIAAIIFKNTKNIAKKLKQVCLTCMQNGLLVVYTGRESIKIGPPLVISKAALEEGLEILRKSLQKNLNEKY